MEKFRTYLDKCLEIICSSILVIMIVTVLYQIFTRVALHKPNTITEEFVRFLLVWLSLLSSAYVAGKNSHLAVTMLSEKLNGKNRQILATIVQVLFVLFAVIVMMYGGWKGVSVTMKQISPSLSISMAYVYLAVPVSGAIMLVYSVLNLLQGKTQETEEVE